MTFDDYRKRFPATRSFQRYTSEQRANHASSHRLRHNQRIAVGEYFYVHEHVPGISFPKRQAAERAGYEKHLQTVEHAPVAVRQADAAQTPQPIHLTHTGPAAGATLCGAARNGSTGHHAVYAPVERDEYRAGCCSACVKVFALSWDADEIKPEWVTTVLSADAQEVASTQVPLFA
jgi:hypothetical protein